MPPPLIKIGVMGSASTSITTEGLHHVDKLAVRLGKKIAEVSGVLITGELDGLPGRVVEVHSQCGGAMELHSLMEYAILFFALRT